MAQKKSTASSEKAPRRKTMLKVGDVVMVIAGGNKKKRPIKGQTGKLLRFVGAQKERVVVEGLNMVIRHKRATTPNASAGRLQQEGSVHISNVMYYAEKVKAPVKLHRKRLADGRSVRGYSDPASSEFVQVDV